MQRFFVFSFWAVLLAAFLFSGCQIEKRVHRPGYHVQWIKKPNAKRKKDRDSAFSDLALSRIDVRQPLLEGGGVVDFPEPREQTGLSALPSKELVQDPDEECQLLVMTDGRRLDVKVLEISQYEIKYRKCGMPEGPLVIVDKMDVDRIIYENGAVDIISGYSSADETVGASGSNRYATSREADGPKRLEVLGMLSMIFAIVGIFFAGIILGAAAIILAIISISKFSSRPTEFGGRGMAIAGLIIGIVAVAGAIIVLSMMAA